MFVVVLAMMAIGVDDDFDENDDDALLFKATEENDDDDDVDATEPRTKNKFTTTQKHPSRRRCC